jgi:hypothetical protein
MKKGFKSAIRVLFLLFFYSTADAKPLINTIIFNTDSLPGLPARVVLYRPYDQLKRKYTVNASGIGTFSLGRREAKTIEAATGKFTLTLDAIGHKSGRYTFTLSGQKVRYLRIQDRNNYAGLRPFLEVIEVTEQTYEDDINAVK